MGDKFLYCGCFLEFGGRGDFWIYDKSADCALLYARVEYDCGSRHGALYGVYGTLGLALMLFCLRAMQPQRIWNEKLHVVCFLDNQYRNVFDDDHQSCCRLDCFKRLNR